MNYLRKYIRSILLESVERRPKLIFLAGMPGSGKSTAVEELGIGNNFTSCNIDDFYEAALRQHRVPLNLHQLGKDWRTIKQQFEEEGFVPSTAELERFNELKRQIGLQSSLMLHHSVPLFNDKVSQCLQSGENILIDGTAANMRKILRSKEEYEEAGYDVGMIYINTTFESASDRNYQRGKAGKRRLPWFILKQSHEGLTGAIDTYRQRFEPFFEVNNTGSFEEYKENIRELRSEILEWVHS